MRRLIRSTVTVTTVALKATAVLMGNMNRKVLALLMAGTMGLFSLITMDSSSAVSCFSWSDPASWPELGHVPTSNDTAVIPAGRTICLDTTGAKAGKLYVYGTLSNLAAVNVQLTLFGNLIVDQGGVLSLNSSANAVWQILFIVPSEGQFVGGGNVPLDSDVGLWVTGAGRVNLQGAPKTSWTHLTGTASAGSLVINVQDATGWHLQDQLAIAPTEPPTVPGFSQHFETPVIAAINGTQITLFSRLAYNHPSVTFHGATYTAEVMNLTRSAMIEGRPGYRTHFWIHNTSAPASPHIIKYVQFRYLGPWDRGAFTDGNLIGTVGRWGGPHFHENGDFTRGSQVEGSVVRDFGAHAFVPHDSNGVTFQDDIAFNGYLDAYWFDTTDSMGMCMAGPNHLTYNHDIAANILSNPATRGYRISGFFLGFGDTNGSAMSSNVAENDVAVGIQGNVSSSGFIWPEACRDGTWRFDTGNTAHNNAVNGIFVWQNDSLDHQILNFVAYYNGKAGIEHGAYVNNYLYQNVSLYGNASVALKVHALTRPNGPHSLGFVNSYFDAAGHQYAVMTGDHSTAGGPVYFIGDTFTGYTVAGIHLAASSGSAADNLDIDATSTLSGNRYFVENTVPASDLVKDHNLNLVVHRHDQTGDCSNGHLNLPWNAWVCPF
jgi:hypothetical protein